MKIGIALFKSQHQVEIAEKDLLTDSQTSIGEHVYLYNYAMWMDTKNEKSEYHSLSNFEINDLPQDVLWFSNLSKDELWISGYLMKHNIKDNQFFNTSFNAIRNLLSTSLETEEQILPKMLFIFEKLVSMSIVLTNAKFDNHIGSFSYAIASGQQNKNIMEIPDGFKDILPHMYMNTSRVITELEFVGLKDSHTIPITLKSNGIIYTEKLLKEVTLPTIDAYTNYQILNGSRLELEMKELCDYLNYEYRNVQTSLNYLEIPFLVEVTARVINPLNLDKETFLQSTHYTKTIDQHIERSWMTSEEFKSLSRFFTFKINRVVFFDKMNNDEIISEYGLIIPQITNISYFSLISCLLLENYTLSLSERVRETQHLDLLGVFLSAKEKQTLMMIGLLLHEKGYKVINYGRNQINLLAKDGNEVEEIANFVSPYGYFIL